MTEGERVKEIRTSLKMTAEKFGERLGVGRSAISNIESGARKVTDQMRRSICREYNVNYDWLANGTGEIFTEYKTLVDEVAARFNFGELEKRILSGYMKLRPKDKEKVLEYIRVFMLGQQADNQEDEIENEVEDYRRQLELEKRQEEQSEVSPGEEGNTEMA